MQRQLPHAIHMHNCQLTAEMTLQCIELVTFVLILPNCNYISCLQFSETLSIVSESGFPL